MLLQVVLLVGEVIDDSAHIRGWVRVNWARCRRAANVLRVRRRQASEIGTCPRSHWDKKMTGPPLTITDMVPIPLALLSNCCLC